MVSLLVGVAVSAMGEQLARRTTPLLARSAQVAVLAAALLVFAWGDREVLLRATPREVSRLVWGANPFPESVEIARYIQANTQPGDRIAVLGSEPQIYFYARRRSATPYILTYDLMYPGERARSMQLDMIRELEEAKPAVLVFVSVYSLLAGPGGLATRSLRVVPATDEARLPPGRAGRPAARRRIRVPVGGRRAQGAASGWALDRALAPPGLAVVPQDVVHTCV